MAARLVPSQCILSLFYTVFNFSTAIVDRDYLFRFKVRVGHNKSHTREDITNMPFDFADNPSGLIPFFHLVLKLDHLHLHSVLWGATGGALQVRQDDPLQAIVAGKTDEIGDPLLFAELIQAWTGKCSIAPEPKLLEPRP